MNTDLLWVTHLGPVKSDHIQLLEWVAFCSLFSGCFYCTYCASTYFCNSNLYHMLLVWPPMEWLLCLVFQLPVFSTETLFLTQVSRYWLTANLELFFLQFIKVQFHLIGMFQFYVFTFTFIHGLDLVFSVKTKIERLQPKFPILSSCHSRYLDEWWSATALMDWPYCRTNHQGIQL